MRVKLILILTILFLLTSCSETKSTDPIEVYKYWAGVKPTEDFKLTNGQYWKSSHWTNEYIMYLELNPTEKWWIDFIKQNNLKLDSINSILPNDKPTWFNPSSNYLHYKLDDSFDQGSRYYRDTLTGKCFIYEIQL